MFTLSEIDHFLIQSMNYNSRGYRYMNVGEGCHDSCCCLEVLLHQQRSYIWDNFKDDRNYQKNVASFSGHFPFSVHGTLFRFILTLKIPMFNLREYRMMFLSNFDFLDELLQRVLRKSVFIMFGLTMEHHLR